MNKLFYWYSKWMLKVRGKTIYNSKKHRKSRISSGSWFINSSMDRYSYMGYDCKVFDTQIGNFCSIGQNVSIGISSHPLHIVSTSPVFYSKRNIFNYGFNETNEKAPVTVIEDDVFIGSGVFIKSGVKISRGAVIGMGAIVTRDIGPYEVWAGNPAKFIKKRFSEDVITKLLKIDWPNWDKKRLEDNSHLFLNTDMFIKRVLEES